MSVSVDERNVNGGKVFDRDGNIKFAGDAVYRRARHIQQIGHVSL